MRDRADKILVSLGLTRTRSQAQLLIKEGFVFVNGCKVQKSGQLIEATDVSVLKEKIYAGRGGNKLEKALDFFALDLQDCVVVDVGASTGGFTQVVLERGARKVFAIDVGHGQLFEELICDPRVVNMEGINAKETFVLPEEIDLAVVDVSFISLTLIMKNVWDHLSKHGQAIVLVKPQYETGSRTLLRNGIVTEKWLHIEILKKIYAWLTEHEMYVHAAMRSPLLGKKGNKEFFFYLKKIISVSFKESLLENLCEDL